MLVIGWLTLLICLWTTGDLVIDMVFEEPDMVADTHATAEEPDNAAEHLLMPSQRAANSTESVVAADPATNLDAFSIALTVTDNAAPGAASSNYQPPPTRPISEMAWRVSCCHCA